jgi:hypothetical protein
VWQSEPRCVTAGRVSARKPAIRFGLMYLLSLGLRGPGACLLIGIASMASTCDAQWATRLRVRCLTEPRDDDLAVVHHTLR